VEVHQDQDGLKQEAQALEQVMMVLVD